MCRIESDFAASTLANFFFFFFLSLMKSGLEFPTRNTSIQDGLDSLAGANAAWKGQAAYVFPATVSALPRVPNPRFFVIPVLSKCSLARIMASQPINPKTNNPIRPQHLPPPTVLPLRHCSHNKENTPIDEVECLLSLLCPSKETMRNKEHYMLATAEPLALEKTHSAEELADPRKRKRLEAELREATKKAQALRAGARAIPGVPIIYVKRSVMILEPFSEPSEKVRLGVEKNKFKTGIEDVASIVAGIKRKREEEELKKELEPTVDPRKLKKAKGPNPLSVKKPKKREKQRPEDQGKKRKEEEQQKAEGEAGEKKKSKRKRKHHKSAKAAGQTVEAEPAEPATAEASNDKGDDQSEG